MLSHADIFGFEPAKEYSKPVAYFSMEFAIDQALKIYSGGLGFLAGSHLRSAYEHKQHLLGIGMLWKYGYYDQVRDIEGIMKPIYTHKMYSFLHDTGIIFPIEIHGAEVFIKAYLLKPSTFESAPLFLLTTDIEQNDHLSRSITNRLYDSNEATRIAQSMVLGIGGAKLLDILGLNIEVYHKNEGDALPLNFYLFAKYKSLDEVKKRVVFTTHTPEKAGNEEHSYQILKEMSFFYHMQDHEVKHILSLEGDMFNYTLAALKFAKLANGVSQLHGQVAKEMWEQNQGICEIKAITNAQNKKYWKDDALEIAYTKNDDKAFIVRKKELKSQLFKIVADQTGKIFDPNVLTLVWARRFAGYKRADFLMRDFLRFMKLVSNAAFPIQIIWAGKPYPEDKMAIETFNELYWKSINLPNVTVLTGYELTLSAALKKGSDVWLNNPKMYHEASGTSGMTAAMNGSVNFSIPDGWVPEFARHGENSFLISPASRALSVQDQDENEGNRMFEILENEILPKYYNAPEKWMKMVKQAMKDVAPAFESGRMVKEYYEKLYAK